MERPSSATRLLSTLAKGQVAAAWSMRTPRQSACTRMNTCRASRQVFIRVHADCRGVRMLHAAATCPFANVDNKRVALEGRSIHELQFVPANPPEVLFDVFLAPVIAVNHDPNLGLKSW